MNPNAPTTHTATDDHAPEFDMRCVLGVIDLKSGLAVHAIAGDRQSYRPVKCPATDTGDALRLACSYRDSGVGGLYVADLDAIASRPTNGHVLADLAKLGLPLWIDAGMADITQSLGQETSGTSRIIGTESIDSLETMQSQAARWLGQGMRPVLSLDQHHGCLLCANDTMASFSPHQIVSAAIQAGIHWVIVLDLSAVGTAKGPATLASLRQLNAAFPDVSLISGGGVRTITDAIALRQAGCNHVLVGTSLHGGLQRFAFPGRSC